MPPKQIIALATHHHVKAAGFDFSCSGPRFLNLTRRVIFFTPIEREFPLQQSGRA